MDVQFKLEGLDAILKKMNQLGPEVSRKGARFAGRKAANVIRDAAIERARQINDPATREEIAKNLAVKFSSKAFRRSGDVSFRVGILGGARQYANTRENRRKRRVGQSYVGAGEFVSSGQPGGDTFYWRFLEFGTQKAKARPFMRPALDTSSQPAYEAFVKHMNAWLDRHFRKNGVTPSI